MRRLLLSLLAGLSVAAVAQNPLVSGQFTADPTARVFGDRVYLYPSHDIFPPDGQRQDWFCMADYHVFSSEDLSDWTDHGVILSQENVPWGNPQGFAMWAPDCVCRDGTYYFYFPNAPKETRGFAIGVATAKSPEGPFSCEPLPIKGIFGIDPCVLLDDDGSAYIYWSGMGIRGAKLKDNMKELDGKLEEIQMPQRPGNANSDRPAMPPMVMGGEEMKGLPEGFKEGPFAFKRNGWYYLTFPWVRNEGSTETLAYAMSRSPLGPWDFKGIIMAEHANKCWTNHHSLLELRGQWYLFYHRNDYSVRDDKRRSACAEKLSFNADGTIREVVPTLRGVGITKATSQIQIDRYSTADDYVTIAFNDSLSPFQGWNATLPRKGSWLCYDDVDFSMVGDAYLVCRVKADEEAPTALFVREKGPKGKVIAEVPITVVSEQGPFRRDLRGQWLVLTASLKYTPKGTCTLCVTCEGGQGVSVDWLQFKNRPNYYSAIKEGGMNPDSEGYIRRWLLLEPIAQDIRSNIVFTDSWLLDAFKEPLPAGQSSALPKDGQRQRVGKQNLAWRALDSETYNVRLFRFAEKWGQQTYGSLFWGVTVIDCPQEISRVRLAAGSNGASMWWLNGEEVLLLSGDRRMVEDDGMSPLLTLKKGRNILRCAVINGPGLSDFCVRFLNEQGQPITDYTINIQ